MEKTFIKFGHCDYVPTQILQKNLFPPTKIVNRETTSFVGKQLMRILIESNKIRESFESNYFEIKENDDAQNPVQEEAEVEVVEGNHFLI